MKTGTQSIVFFLSMLVALPIWAEGINVELIEAAKKGDTATVLVLLEKGADIETRDDEYKATPLLHASAKGHPKTVQALIDKGAN